MSILPEKCYLSRKLKLMREDFLHFLWQTKRFDFSNLKTTSGEEIIIYHTGEPNVHAGPDFLNAKLQIGETVWAGNVEMHLRSSDWRLHQHSSDPAYESVILHVVFEEDEGVFRNSGERLPCLEMKKRIPPNLIQTYQVLLHNQYWIPCQHQLHAVTVVTKNLWLDRLLVERLEQKIQAIAVILSRNQNNWEETFYQVLARNFGVKINAEPFEMLAQATPLLTLTKHKNNLFQIEALLFGQAGLLEVDFEEDYPRQLKTEYQFLKTKFQLSPIPMACWKFLRLRPPNFPTIRIAQFAALIFQSVHLFSKILKTESPAQIEQLFDLQLSDYWLTHYVFDKISKPREKSLGKNTVHLFVINTVAPFLFLYGKEHGDDALKDRAIQLLESVPAEQNHVIEKWRKLGLSPESAYQTQALLQLKNEYCDRQRCLKCAIGSAILKG
jgi:hypothetical protein